MGERKSGGSGRGGRRRRRYGLTTTAAAAAAAAADDDEESSSVSSRAGLRTGASSTARGPGPSAAAEDEAVKERDVTEARSFPHHVKQQCWDKAERIKGRDPDRWRRDALGNTVFRKLVGCPGCLCHDYDHIVPYSKGGKSTLENCQVLQATVNRSKGNKTEISKAELIQKSAYCRVSGRDMDLLELSAYGNVRRGRETGGCSIQ